MKSLYSAFGTVEEYEKSGVILDFGVAKFKVRRAGGSNREFLTLLATKMRPHRRAIEAGTLDDEVGKALHLEVYFKSVVVGWEGVTDRAGNVLEYNLQNFKQVMTELPDLWDRLRMEADSLKNFQEAETEEDGAKLGE